MASSGDRPDVVLLWGKNGWIGGKLIALLREQGKDVRLAESRLENREAVAAELDAVQPTRVINAAGLTGRPNVDWCDFHKQETIRVNVIGTLNLVDLCYMRDIHVTNFATGCIFEYDEAHPMGGAGFTEDDNPNFDGSFYSLTKGMVDILMREYPNCLTLRVRMPISDDLSPRNFITKILKYQKVVNIPNSMTVLTDLLPVGLIMSERRLGGIYNYTNPGVISHNQILDLYKQYIDPEFTYENFTIEEQDRILAAKRSNNCLETDKMVQALPDVEIKPILEAIHGVFQRMRANLEAEGTYPDNLPKRKIAPHVWDAQGEASATAAPASS